MDRRPNTKTPHLNLGRPGAATAARRSFSDGPFPLRFVLNAQGRALDIHTRHVVINTGQTR